MASSVPHPLKLRPVLTDVLINNWRTGSSVSSASLGMLPNYPEQLMN